MLVDAELRRATIHKRFGFARSTGLSDLLLGDGVLEDHALDVGVDNLRVLPAGTTPPNPDELLASPGRRTVQQYLIERADLVIYATPAVLAAPDALELGRYVDLAVLVGRAGVTSRRQLTAAVERLSQVGTDIAGTVLNDIEGGNDGYYYSYYYADDRDEERRPWRRKSRSEPGGDDAAVPPGPSRERPEGVPPTGPTPLLGAPGARRSDRRRDRGRSAVPEDAEQSPAAEGVGTHYSAVRPVPSPRDPTRVTTTSSRSSATSAADPCVSWSAGSGGCQPASARLRARPPRARPGS